VPKGVLLVGPPGTGKTLLARAVAGEAGVPFFSINGPEFVEMFVGVGAARVRDLFEKARGQAPAIIFIDELDALGRARGSVAFGGGHDEKEQTLNQLLSELDGFDPSSGLVLLAATNRPEVLDPALLRAGRFDRQVLVDRPDRAGRQQILALYLKKVKCADGLGTEELATLTPGFTGADLANLVNEAALAATRRNANAVELVDFQTAIERIVAGLEKRSRILRPEERRIVATHELGHAIVAMALPGTDPVQKISIIPRGIAGLGYTLQRPADDRFLNTREELEAKMAVLLGGRAAERLVFSDMSSGAADDLEKATFIARTMVTRFGMDDTLGNVSYAETPSFLGQPAVTTSVSPDTAAAIDKAVHAFIESAYHRALATVKRHHLALETWAERLLTRETLEGEDLVDLRAAIATTARLPANAGLARVMQS
jgi:cell division protease FtsH